VGFCAVSVVDVYMGTIVIDPLFGLACGTHPQYHADVAAAVVERRGGRAGRTLQGPPLLMHLAAMSEVSVRRLKDQNGSDYMARGNRSNAQ